MGWQAQSMANDGSSYQDPSTYDSYPNNGMSTTQQTDMQFTPSAHMLTRRPLNQNLVAQNYANAGNGSWNAAENGGGSVPAGDTWPAQYDELDQRAEMAKRDSQSKRKQIPPFIQKLSRYVSSPPTQNPHADEPSFLDEDRNTELIRWSDSGDSFIVLDEDEFAKTLIPELFKHNNYASFVRQLNMYGFHKKVGLSDNSMRASERKNKNPSEYSNPYFKRGRPNLLWLIHKPKNPPGKGSGKGRNKQEDFDEEVDETFARETTPIPNQDQLDSGTGFHSRQQPLLTMGSMADRLPQNELTSLRQELREVQANQLAIREMLQRTRQEHQQLYGQAKAFHELHEKHDNSINAILSFLATVYNKNLAAGQTGSGEMFPGAIPSNNQPSGNVVDMGDEKEQTPQPYGRKPQLLLEAGTKSPASPNMKNRRKPSRQTSDSLFYDKQTHSPAIQELSDHTPSARSSPGQSPLFRPTDASTDSTKRPIPEADILRMMNNASSGTNTAATPMRMDFPEALSHLQTADGQSPLTPHQRQNMLQLMNNDLSAASPNSLSNNNQALTYPTTPPNNLGNSYNQNMANFDMTSDHLNQVQTMLRQQEEKMAALQQTIAPLSPSGSIPGLNDTGAGYNNGTPGAGDLDFNLNDWADSGDYFNDGMAQLPDMDFDFGMSDDAANAAKAGGGGIQGEGVGEGSKGGEAETVGSSEGTSPAGTVEEAKDEGASPGKRRRRN